MEASRGSPESGLIRRWVEALAFVGVWIAAGELLDMSGDIYLLFGIPLTAGFQLFVRKRPIKDLWVRGGPGLSPRTVSLRLAIPLAIVPCVHLAVSVVKGQGLGYIGYALAAIVGAGAAAYALGRFRRETWRYLGLCVATASLLGVLLTIGAAWHDASMVHPTGGRLHPSALFGIESLLLYIPALFMMEEVASGRNRLARTPSGRAAWRRVDDLWHRISDHRVDSLGPLAPPNRAQRNHPPVAPLTGRDGTLPLPLLAQVGEPHGARVRACPERFGAKRLRPCPVTGGVGT